MGPAQPPAAETALDGVGCKLREVEALRNDLDAVRSLKVDLCGTCFRITTENRKINQASVGSIISVELGDLSLGFSF